MNIRIPTLALAAVLAAAFAGGALAQTKTPKLYKWVDKHGVVHYGSSVPPEYANQQIEVLNSEGITVKTVAAPKTAEELAREQQQQAAAAAKAQQEQQQQAGDRMLLDTYTSVAEIERDRDGHIAALKSQINVTNGAIADLQNTLTGYQRRAQELQRTHRPTPASLKSEMDSAEQQLLSYQHLLAKQQQEEQATKERYAGYIKRFRQLTQNQGNGGG